MDGLVEVQKLQQRQQLQGSVGVLVHRIVGLAVQLHTMEILILESWDLGLNVVGSGEVIRDVALEHANLKLGRFRAL